MDCTEVADDLDLLALGTLSPAEAERVRAHIAACARCRAELQAAEEVVARLALAVPPVRAPDTLRTAVMAAAHHAPPVERSRPRLSPWRRPLMRWSAAAAAVALALGGTLTWVARLQGQVNELRQEAAAMRRQADGLLLFVVPSSIRADFQPVAGQTAAGAVTWNPVRGVCYVVFERLPRPEPGSAYRLWYVADGVRRVDAGEVVPDDAGRADLVIDASRWRGQSYELVLRLERTPHDPEAPAVLTAAMQRPPAR
jgi:hypothetical protein